MRVNIIEQVIAQAGSQKALADLLGVSKAFVNQIAQGERPIPAERCARIEESLGIPCEQLRPLLQWVRDADGRVTHYMVPAASEKQAA